MINNYICKLIGDLQYYKNKENINIILEGGLFNGSYLIGIIYYLKQLEEKQFIKISKISGCSIGSLIGLLYFINVEDLFLEIYNISKTHYKKHYNLNIFHKLFKLIKKKTPKNIIEQVQDKLYITYFDIYKGEQIIKSNYKSINDLFDTIRRSCSFPFLIDNNLFYKNKYIDGLYPYVFDDPYSKNLYLTIIKFNKLINVVSIKNEKTNMNRILEGIIDVHKFFITNKKTDICSYTNEWSIIDYSKYKLLVLYLQFVIFITHKIFILYHIMKKSCNKSINISILFKEVYKYYLKAYCI